VFDSSEKRGKPYEFELGSYDVIRGWETAVTSMCVGERALFVIHPDMARNYKQADEPVPEKSVLQFEMTFVDFAPKDEEWPPTEEGKLQVARQRQEAGKQLFQQERFIRANAKYEKGAKLLENLLADDKQLNAECQKTRVILLGNQCLCYQKMGRFCESIQKGKEALQAMKDKLIDDDDLKTKLYVRLLKSLISEGRNEEAVRYAQEGTALVKDAGLIQKELVRAQQNLKAEQDKKQ